MYIKKIYLKNFRNYEEQEIDFDKNINIIYGNNAMRENKYTRSNFC